MKKEINFGIGFVTGRANVCKIINSYYNDMLEQLEEYDANVNLTIFIMYDLSYNYTKRTDFYSLIPDIYRKNITVKYISPEEIDNEKKYLQGHFGLSKDEAELFLGAGHAKGRNTVMYYALKEGMDYLLFWDDDEYPLACIKDETGKITWIKQRNVVSHLEYFEREGVDVTRGYHCGYISPIPSIPYGENVSEDDFKNFIEACGNEAVNWKNIKERFEKDNGVTFADPDLANGLGPKELVETAKDKKWVAGSTLGLNLKHIDKIPAFYNPPGGRGEDTFFSVGLTNSKVMQIPVYHFHDGFLKYTDIMNGHMPKKLKLIESQDDADVEKRFLKVTTGWIKYKPLYLYIMDKENYSKNIRDAKAKLSSSISSISDYFEHGGFAKLPEILEEYDEEVEEHYQDFLDTNRIWDKLKTSIVTERKNK